MEEVPNLLLGSMEATMFVEELLINGIKYLLEETDVNIVCPAVVGNHSRITEKVWRSTEEDNSLELIVYHHVKKYFEGNKRFKLIIPSGPDRFMDIYGLTVAFCHGHHGFRYSGGVGGLYVPVRRRLLTKYSKRKVDIVCMGHFHQYIQDSLFMVNGSMIGYDHYANSLGLGFDIPKQTFFLIDKKRQCRTVTTPIIFSV